MPTQAELKLPADWHTLYQRLCHTQDSRIVNKTIRELADLTMEDAYSEVLRLTFLSEFFDLESHTKKAGLMVLNSPELAIDCAQAFTALNVMRALRYGDRERFIHSIANAQLPGIIQKLNGVALSAVQEIIKPRMIERPNRIALVNTYFGSPFHTPSILALNYAQVLASLGMKANIYTCQEFMPNNMGNFHGAGRGNLLPSLNAKDWEGLLPPEVLVTATNQKRDMAARWRTVLLQIAQFDPDVVLCVGPFSPLASALYSVRPAVALPTNSVSFLGCADVWLKGTHDEPKNEAMTWGGAFPLPLAHLHPFRIQKRIGQSLRRSDFGLGENTVILVTVGFRLESEIDGDYANQMLEMLSQSDDLVWVLVGGKEIPKALKDAPTGKVINLGVQKDVNSVLRLCDIYVNPPRMGGGFSVLEAMSHGICTLAFENTDGGEKLGELSCVNSQMYFDQLRQLIKHPEKRVALGLQLEQRFKQYYDLKSSGPSLLQALNTAISHAKQRLTGFF